MKQLEFDHAVRGRLLNFRRALNKAAQCMNMSSYAMQRAIASTEKSQARLAASTARLQHCMELQGL